MIQAIIFDCFGVLYRDNLDLQYERVPRDKYRDMRDIVHASDHGIISREEYYQAIAELTGQTTDAVREIEKRQFVRNEQLFAYVRTLRATYKIGLLSNIGDTTMDRLFPGNERDELFDAFVLSSDVGVIKPDPKIFLIGAERLGVPASNCLMIDDRIENCNGAELAGMKSLLFANNRQFERDFTAYIEAQRA